MTQKPLMRNISTLEYDKPYCVIGIKIVENSYKNRTGMFCTIKDLSTSSFIQLPTRYHKVLDEHDVCILQKDIATNNYPFLIIRDKMVHNSQYIDFLSFSTELLQMHNRWENVPNVPDDQCIETNSTPQDPYMEFMVHLLNSNDNAKVNSAHPSKNPNVDKLEKEAIDLMNANLSINYEEEEDEEDYDDYANWCDDSDM